MIRENLIHKLNEELGDIWGGSKEILADEILAAIREEINLEVNKLPMSLSFQVSVVELDALSDALDRVFGERKI